MQRAQLIRTLRTLKISLVINWNFIIVSSKESRWNCAGEGKNLFDALGGWEGSALVVCAGVYFLVSPRDVKFPECRRFHGISIWCVGATLRLAQKRILHIYTFMLALCCSHTVHSWKRSNLICMSLELYIKNQSVSELKRIKFICRKIKSDRTLPRIYIYICDSSMKCILYIGANYVWLKRLCNLRGGGDAVYERVAWAVVVEGSLHCARVCCSDNVRGYISMSNDFAHTQRHTSV